MLQIRLFSVEKWRLDQRLWTLIVATFTAYFVFETTSWLSLGSFGLMVIALSFAYRRERMVSAWRPLPPWFYAGSIYLAYVAASSTWSADPRSTLLTALVLAYLIIGMHLISRQLDHCPTVWLEHITRTIAITFVFALLYYCIEELTDNGIKRVLFWPFKAIRVSSDGIAWDRVTSVAISPTTIKWRIPALTFLLWPVLFINSLQLTSHRRLASGVNIAIFGVTGWLVWKSAHTTSQVAFIAALAAFALASWHSMTTWRAVALAWCLSFLLIIPLALLLYRADLHLDARLAASTRARLILWGHTAEQIKLHPFIGVGAAATKLLDHRGFAEAESKRPGNFAYAIRTGPHAHNIFLQSWYELGAIGTLLMIAFGLFALRGMAAFPIMTHAYLIPTVATVGVTASASFGLFEPWFMGAFAMCATTALIALAYSKRLQ